jgi:hypothetical protein
MRQGIKLQRFWESLHESASRTVGITQYSPTNPPIAGCSTSLVVPPGPYPAVSFSGVSVGNSNLLYSPQTNNYGGKIGYGFGAGIGTGSPAGSYYIWAVVDGYAIPYSAATFSVT